MKDQKPKMYYCQETEDDGNFVGVIQIFGFKTEDECKIYLSKYMKKDNKNNNYIIMGTETIH
jgi:hypothetical protein